MSVIIAKSALSLSYVRNVANVLDINQAAWTV